MPYKYPDEIVQVVDPSWPKEKQDAVIKENTEAKLRYAARKEEERINRKSLWERGIEKVKMLFAMTQNKRKKQTSKTK